MTNANVTVNTVIENTVNKFVQIRRQGLQEDPIISNA